MTQPAAEARLHDVVCAAQGTRVGVDTDSVRYQVCRLMRMLVQVCQTLDQVPSEVRRRCGVVGRGVCRTASTQRTQPTLR